jgi:hemolysin III
MRRDPRTPSRAELVADAVVHIAGMTLGIAGSAAVLTVAASRSDLSALMPVLVYALCLLIMLASSAAYHLLRSGPHRALLQRLDHAAIFVMIAGTYTPFTLLGLTGFWRWGLITLVWALAVLGIVAKLRGWRWPEWLWIPLYLAIGWLFLVVADRLIAAQGGHTMALIAAGGILYSAGVCFHLWERLKFRNAIWHGFVLCAAATHYAAIVGIVATA